MFHKILTPVDGSESSKRALDAACDLAKRYDSELVVLHVMEKTGSQYVTPEGAEALERLEHIRVTEADVLHGVARGIVNEAALAARDNGVTRVTERIADGNPGQVIVVTAREENADLIVMGRRGLGRVADLLLGSVSHRTAQLADCACMTVK